MPENQSEDRARVWHILIFLIKTREAMKESGWLLVDMVSREGSNTGGRQDVDPVEDL
jgi:hypothetical protein